MVSVYILEYEVCAIILTCIILAACIMGRIKHDLQFKIYVSMLVYLLVTSITDLLSGYFINHIEKYSIWYIYILEYIYFIFKMLMIVMYCLYNLESAESCYRRNRKLWVVITIPSVFGLVLLAINTFTNVIFKIDKVNGFVRGKLIGVIYAISIFYIVFVIFYIRRFDKIIEKYKLHNIEFFAIVTILSVIIQCVNPRYLVESFGEAICFLVLYFNVQKPDDLIDGRVATFNRKAFMDRAKVFITSKIPFNVISVSIEDYEYLEKIFGKDCMSDFEINLADYLNSKTKDMKIYRVSDYMFYIVSNVNTYEQMKDLAEEIFKDCDRVWMVGDVEIPVIMDICLIRYPEDVSELEELFTCTNYFAKEDHGKENRVIIAGDNEYYNGRRKSKVKLAIHKAIKNKSFEVYFQPIYSTKNKKINSAEALVRLKDEELGFISPEEFIPIAEEDGSIIRIDDFVLDEVCRFAKENELSKKGIEYIEVNVSVIECMKHDMAKRVSDKIEKYGLHPGQINLEITETATVNSPQMLDINMRKLVEGGVQFSLDDYGTGYSNINYLINLPFHLIKMDKTIVWSSFKNDKAGIALDSSVKMIRKLGFHIVAEGIENAEQAAKLEDIGCEYLQGYYYSKPLSQNDFLNFLDD